MIARSFNSDFINSVANDKAVSGGSKLSGIGDLSQLVENKLNVLLVYEFGGFILINKGFGVYEVHTMALKKGRGRMLRNAIDCALEYMFFCTDCERIITMAYKDNPASVALSNAYFDAKGGVDGYAYYDLSYHSWIRRSEKAKMAGHEFHGAVDTNHDEDELHDRYAGGSILILKNGNPAKAAKLYNEWAVMSKYEMIEIVGVNPLIAKMGDMTLIYHNSVLEQIPCQ